MTAQQQTEKPSDAIADVQLAMWRGRMQAAAEGSPFWFRCKREIAEIIARRRP